MNHLLYGDELKHTDFETVRLKTCNDCDGLGSYSMCCGWTVEDYRCTACGGFAEIDVCSTCDGYGSVEDKE